MGKSGVVTDFLFGEMCQSPEVGRGKVQRHSKRCARELRLKGWDWVRPMLVIICPSFHLGVRNSWAPRVRNFQKH